MNLFKNLSNNVIQENFLLPSGITMRTKATNTHLFQTQITSVSIDINISSVLNMTKHQATPGVFKDPLDKTPRPFFW